MYFDTWRNFFQMFYCHCKNVNMLKWVSELESPCDCVEMASQRQWEAAVRNVLCVSAGRV